MRENCCALHFDISRKLSFMCVWPANWEFLFFDTLLFFSQSFHNEILLVLRNRQETNSEHHAKSHNRWCSSWHWKRLYQKYHVEIMIFFGSTCLSYFFLSFTQITIVTRFSSLDDDGDTLLFLVAEWQKTRALISRQEKNTRKILRTRENVFQCLSTSEMSIIEWLNWHMTVEGLLLLTQSSSKLTAPFRWHRKVLTCLVGL